MTFVLLAQSIIQQFKITLQKSREIHKKITKRKLASSVATLEGDQGIGQFPKNLEDYCEKVKNCDFVSDVLHPDPLE